MFTAKIADIWLAGPTHRELARSIRPSYDFGLQEIAALRASAITVADRRNDKLTLSFEATHWFNDINDCMADWLTDHVAAIRAVGKAMVTLTYLDNTQRFLPLALVKCTPLEFHGQSADYRYDIHAGAVLGVGQEPLFVPYGTAQITGSNTSVTINVTGLTAAHGNIRVNQTSSTGGTTQFIVACADGHFTIQTPQPPELAPGDGRVFNFTWDLVNL